MLVLTRRVGEEIVIDGKIRIIVTGLKGDKVRIGITAPNSVRVDRHEVHERRAQFARLQPAMGIKEVESNVAAVARSQTA